MKIATILTCHNRRAKTILCIDNLYNAFDRYNMSHDEIDMKLFITDDGCTDGTIEAVQKKFGQREIIIAKGNGQLFWAGGMRAAWNEALNNGEDYEFFLLLNDDTIILENCFEELFQTNDYSIREYNRKGIYSGITCSNEDPHKITYGGSVWVNRLLAKTNMLTPCGKPQLCDMTNANILLVAKEVVDEIGILFEGYSHAIADYDYSISARRRNIPVLVTSEVCGKCDDDHGTPESNGKKICSMSLKDRIRYFNHPLHSNKDYLLFIRRNAPLRYPLVLMGRLLNVYFPVFYYKLFLR